MQRATHPHTRFANAQPRPRRGAMLVLVSALLVILLAMTLFTVDVAYMQLTRAELRSGTDAAAKAGAEALRRTKNEAQARAAVKDIAAKNTVGGKTLVVQDSEIEFGSTQLQANGHWDFQAGSTPYTAVRVGTTMGGGTGNQPVQLFFADVFGSGTFEPTRTSTAAHTKTEICLCIDRSHSMCFDLTGVDWRYPGGGGYSVTNYLKAPHPTYSRWGVLMKSVNEFVKIIEQQNPPPRVALTTWGSNITYGGLSFPASSLDLPLTTSHSNINSSINGRSLKTMLGGTNMSTGMQEALALLTANNVDPLASRIMILMSDGEWNQGIDPTIVAEQAKQNKVIVHTISFISNGNQAALEDVALITGGRFYSASNPAELEAAFTHIARQLPVVLTD